MRGALLGLIVCTILGLGLSTPVAAQGFPFFGKQPPGPSCVEVCELVRTIASTPYPHEACFTSPYGRTLCQPFTQYRAEDRYVRRCHWSCATRG